MLKSHEILVEGNPILDWFSKKPAIYDFVFTSDKFTENFRGTMEEMDARVRELSKQNKNTVIHIEQYDVSVICKG